MDLRSDRVERRLAITVVSLAAVYLALAILIPACLAWHGGHHARSHGQAGPPVHSLLCAWMCQAGSLDGFSVAPSLLIPVSLMVAGVALVLTRLLQPSFRQAHSRAPPRALR